MRKELVKGLGLFAGLVALDVTARVGPHVPGVSPVLASALFAGFMFRRRLPAVSVPVAAMALSDSILGGYEPGVMASVYLCLVLPAVAGTWLRQRPSVLWVGGAALGASALYFAMTNLAVWFFGGWYPRDLAGLGAAYAAALPFFKFTLAGDLLWSTAFFGGFAAACRLRLSLGRPVGPAVA